MKLAYHKVTKTMMDGLTKPWQQGLEKGYIEGTWRELSAEDHLASALRHIYKHLDGETHNEDEGTPTRTRHLENALCRVAMALEVSVNGKRN